MTIYRGEGGTGSYVSDIDLTNFQTLVDEAAASKDAAALSEADAETAAASAVSSASQAAASAAIALAAEDQAEAYAETVIGFRNRIINGSMNIFQKSDFASLNPISNVDINGVPAFSVDRWYCQTSLIGTSVNFSRNTSSTVSLNGPNHLTVTTNTIKTSLASFDSVIIGQNIEGFNIADFKFGSGSAKTFTCSFRASVSGAASAVISVAFRNADGTRSYVTSVTVTSTPATYVVTVPGCPTGTWNTSNGSGLRVSFCFASGSSPMTSNANVWESNQNKIAVTTQTNLLAAANSLNITDVQVELAPAATAFEKRSYQTELMLCRRYVKPVYRAIGQCFTTTTCGFLYDVSEMRAAPTLLISGNAQASVANGSGTVPAALTLLNFARNATLLNFTSATPDFVAGNASYITPPAACVLDAEI